MTIQAKSAASPHATFCMAHVQSTYLRPYDILDNQGASIQGVFYWAIQKGWYELAEHATQIVDHNDVNKTLMARYDDPATYPNWVYSSMGDAFHQKAWMQVAIEQTPAEVFAPEGYVKSMESMAVPYDMRLEYANLVEFYRDKVTNATDPLA